MARPIVTLTTDFGTADAFTAVMKGIILGIEPDAAIVDITHEVAPQDIHAGAYLIDSAHGYFPTGTVHVIVVDPGVGTARRPIAVCSPSATYVCPDNGLLSYVLARDGASAATGAPFASTIVPLPEGWRGYHVTQSRYWRDPLSNTFHGRDLFAPVAGHLAVGESAESMGDPIREVTAFNVPIAELHERVVSGTVLHVDRFGNLVTNIGPALLGGRTDEIVVEAGSARIDGLAHSYQTHRGLVALIGSDDRLEIAAPNGSAAGLLGLGVGGQVRFLLPS